MATNQAARESQNFRRMAGRRNVRNRRSRRQRRLQGLAQIQARSRQETTGGTQAQVPCDQNRTRTRSRKQKPRMRSMPQKVRKERRGVRWKHLLLR